LPNHRLEWTVYGDDIVGTNPPTIQTANAVRELGIDPDPLQGKPGGACIRTRGTGAAIRLSPLDSLNAIIDFQGRERRFGMTQEQIVKA